MLGGALNADGKRLLVNIITGFLNLSNQLKESMQDFVFLYVKGMIYPAILAQKFSFHPRSCAFVALFSTLLDNYESGKIT